MRNIQTAVSSYPLKTEHMFIWTYLLGIVHTYHLLKYLLLLLKHPVCCYVIQHVCFMLKTNYTTTIINKESRELRVPLFLFFLLTLPMAATNFSFPQTTKPSFK